MSALREKIETKFVELEQLMDNNVHLEDRDQVKQLIESIAKFWNVLEEGDRDYLEAARYAIEFKKVWK